MRRVIIEKRVENNNYIIICDIDIKMLLTERRSR